jgi:hypothetical protein
MCDGVQFDDRAPVLYVAWDALSGTPLFSERKPFRSEDDLRPMLERVKAMGVPVIAIVSDKEKGLVPAVEAVFPDVPYQFCQTHFMKNCAKPLEKDLSALGGSVVRRATRVHKIAKKINDAEREARERGEKTASVEPSARTTAAPAPGESVVTQPGPCLSTTVFASRHSSPMPTSRRTSVSWRGRTLA